MSKYPNISTQPHINHPVHSGGVAIKLAFDMADILNSDPLCTWRIARRLDKWSQDVLSADISFNGNTNLYAGYLFVIYVCYYEEVQTS